MRRAASEAVRSAISVMVARVPRQGAASSGAAHFISGAARPAGPERGRMTSSIRIIPTPDGALTYAIPFPPEETPAVTARDLLGAWEAARGAAGAEIWGSPRRLIFRRPDGEAMELLLADADAACWAEAVDARHGLATPQGLAICLRLLALIEAMGRIARLKGFFALRATGAELHPALLRAAANVPLDPAGRFDEAALTALLSRTFPAGATL